jgi:hypothetical protein
MIILQFHLESKSQKTIVEEHSINKLFGLSDKAWEELPPEEADKNLTISLN